MQTQKMSLANIKGKLSRAEMKNIMAGSGGNCDHYHYQCNDGLKGCTNSCYNAPTLCANHGGEYACI